LVAGSSPAGVAKEDSGLEAETVPARNEWRRCECGFTRSEYPTVVVNDQYSFVFVHIPKVAGTSISRALQSISGTNTSAMHGKTKHETAKEFLDRVQGTQFFDYRFFAFVRNPWDRFASLHRYLLTSKVGKKHPVPKNLCDFALMLAEREPWVESLHSIRAQSAFVEDSFDFVGRYEALERDFATICHRLGISAMLPRVNATTTQPVDYRQLFDDRSAAVIAERYQDDIRRFGYQY
jgi:hypothetical protein